MTKQAREVLFREAEWTDAAAFLAFMAEVADQTDFLVMDEGGLPFSVKQMETILQESAASAGKLCLLALLDEEVIGVVNVVQDKRQKLAHIGDVFLAVSKPYWGQGIGRILMEEMIAWAGHTHMLHRLELTVQVRNEAAVRLYQSLGFEIEGTKRHGAKSTEGDWLDLYYMGKLIEVDENR